MIDERLRTIAALLRRGSFLCDVGTDHAYLPCYAVKSGITEHAIACDINEKPLAQAKRHIATLELSQNIETVLSDGLKAIPPQKAEDIVIAGMGGELIAKILIECDFARDTAKRFILQPMTNADFLRRELYKNGFYIIEERAVKDKNHFYAIMLCAYGGSCEQVSDCFSLVGMMPAAVAASQKSDALYYIEMQYNRIYRIAKGLSSSKDKHEREKAANYFELAAEIGKLLPRED